MVAAMPAICSQRCPIRAGTASRRSRSRVASSASTRIPSHSTGQQYRDIHGTISASPSLMASRAAARSPVASAIIAARCLIGIVNWASTMSPIVRRSAFSSRRAAS